MTKDYISVQDEGIAGGPASTMALPRRLQEDVTRAEVPIGFPMYRWLLFLGDLMLITIANSLSAWIRFGEPLDTVAMYTIASAITLSIYPVFLYIFDLYNVQRSFRSRATAYRSSLAIALGGFVVMIAFYLLPYNLTEGALWQSIWSLSGSSLTDGAGHTGPFSDCYSQDSCAYSRGRALWQKNRRPS